LFSALAARIGHFRRDSVIDYGARILWKDFNDHARLADINSELSWLRASAAPLIVLGLMYGKGPDAQWIAREEFVNLGWELSQLREFQDADSAEADAARAEIRCRLQALPRMAHLSDDDIRAIWALWNLSNVIGPAVADTDASPSTLVRNYLVYERFRGAYGGATHGEVNAIERSLFLTEPRFFVGAAYALVSYGNDARLKPRDTPGLIFPDENGVREAYPSAVGYDDLMMVVQRLSRKASDFNIVGQELLANENPMARAEAFRMLLSTPIVELDDYSDKAILITGPARLIKSVSRFLQEDTVQRFGRRFGKNASGERGHAFERYLEDALWGTEVRRVAERDSKTPDFEWIGKRYAIFIEAKAKVIPDAAQYSGEGFVAAWENLTEAIEQASSYVDTVPGLRGVRAVLIIVVNDPVTEERAQFRYVASRWGLLNGTQLACLAVWGPGDLEHHVLFSTPDATGEMLERIWHESARRPAMDQPPAFDPYKEEVCVPLVEDGFQHLFGVEPRRLSHE
jgi:hypothetical protein